MGISGFAYAPADIFKNKFLQDAHGLTPAQVSICTLVVGFVTLLSFPHLGRFGDSHGRRYMLTIFYICCPIGVLIFYNVAGILFLPFFFLQMFAGNALWVLSATYYAEQFPDS